MSRISKRGSAREPANAKPSPRSLESIVDELLDSYLRWREACEDVRAAYESWRTCDPQHRLLGFDWYRAALDREEEAACVHSNRVDRLRAATGLGA
jgi:hypothetical protein